MCCATAEPGVAARFDCSPACNGKGAWGFMGIPPIVPAWVKLLRAFAAYWGIWKPVPKKEKKSKLSFTYQPMPHNYTWHQGLTF